MGVKQTGSSSQALLRSDGSRCLEYAAWGPARGMTAEASASVPAALLPAPWGHPVVTCGSTAVNSLTARLSLSRGPAHCKPLLLRKEGEDGFPSAWYRGKFGFEDFSGLIRAQEVCSQSGWERGGWEKLYFFHFTARAPEGWEIDVGSYTWERLSAVKAFLLEGGLVQGRTVPQPGLQAPNRCSTDQSAKRKLFGLSGQRGAEHQIRSARPFGAEGPVGLCWSRAPELAASPLCP